MAPLPSLTALRAFEAAARLESFTAAGHELSMSQSAVSYQVRGLEAALSTTLFVRAQRRVTLTEEGRRLAAAVARGFDLIRTEVSRLGDQALAVTTTGSFANMWLAPRIGAFRAAHPTVAVRIAASPGLKDLTDDGFDVAVRQGRGDWPGVESTKLFDMRFTPMASPDFRSAMLDRIAPVDLLRVNRLAPSDDWWAFWFAAAGVATSQADEQNGIELENLTELTAAAVAGHGVAMLSPAFARRELADGRLLRLFDVEATDDTAYWISIDRRRRHDPRVRSFKRWLLDASVAETTGRP